MSGRTERRLILYMSMSLDGFAAHRDGVIDWLGSSRAQGDRRQRAVAELLGETGLLVLGRKGYEDMSSAWPSSTSPTGQLMNSLPKLVFSSTLREGGWNAEFTNRAPQEAIPELRRQPGKDLVVFGGVRFARSLTEHRLIDEYRLVVHPVVLGDGLSFLHGLPEPVRLELAGSTAWSDGVVTHTYA
jgi:dihydrofolate reductase